MTKKEARSIMEAMAVFFTELPICQQEGQASDRLCESFEQAYLRAKRNIKEAATPETVVADMLIDYSTIMRRA